MDPLLFYLQEYKGWSPTRELNNGVLLGCCPWHPENTPSFRYYPSPDSHIHCYGGGCPVHGDLGQVLAVEHQGADWRPFLPREQARALTEQFLREHKFPPPSQQTGHHLSSARREQLKVPGPLHTKILSRMMGYWHEQLQVRTGPANRVRTYLKKRGVSDQVIEEELTLGYMPDEQYLSLPAYVQVKGLMLATPQELASERDWYQAQGEPWDSESLAFLSTPEAFAQRLGFYTKDGRWRLIHRLIFSCVETNGQVVFYQGRILPQRKGPKFLNPPFRKRFYHVKVPQAQREGTLLTESPFGPLVNASMRLVRHGDASLGEGMAPDWMTLDEPIYCAHDNDPDIKEGELSYPGHVQAQQALALFRQRGKQACRFLPDILYKGFDEHGNAIGPEKMLQALDLAWTLTQQSCQLRVQ